MSETMQTTAHPKKHGVAHLFAAFTYSVAGARRLMQETAMRHEVVAFLAALTAFLLAGVALPYTLGLCILFLLLFATEALNTAIEETVDYISLETSQRAKHAKDLGSFAVFCMLCATGLYTAGMLVHTLLLK